MKGKMMEGNENRNLSLGESLQGKARVSRRSFLKLAGAASLFTVSGGLLSACSSNSSSTSSSASGGTRTVTDMSGATVTLPDNVTKYVEDWYAHNEIDIMLNQAEGMVMTNCSEANFPWMYKVCSNMSKAKYSAGETPNFEEVAELGPQVMFTQNTDLRAKCEEVGIAMVDVMFKNFDEMQKSVSLTAEVLGGNAVDIANSYNSELSKVLSDVKSKTANLSDSEKPRVLTGNSVYTLDLDGTGTIIEAWIDACGGKQVVTGTTTGNTQAEYTLEQVIAWNPEIIITDKPEQVDEILNDSSWASIDAVKNKKVYANPQGVFMWNRYGVEEILQLQWASKLFHPDLFKNVDMDSVVKTFYKNFLHYDLTDTEVTYIMEAKDPDGSVHQEKGSD